MKFLIGSVLAGMLVFSGCQTFSIPEGTTRTEYMCAQAPTLHSLFRLVVAKGKVPADIVAEESQAYRVILEVCKNPNAPGRLQVLINKYIEIEEAKAAAEAVAAERR